MRCALPSHPPLLCPAAQPPPLSPAPAARRRLNPLALLGGLRPRNMGKALKARKQDLQRLVWRLEDASIAAAKFARKFVFKSARPVLVCEWRACYDGSRAVKTEAG